MPVYFSSDFHLGHKNIMKYRTMFQTMKDHDEEILYKISKLNKRDVLFVLGDFLFDCKEYTQYIKELSKMSCRIKLIMGNHDSLKLYKEDIFEIQLPLFSYKKFWLSHCPIYEKEMRQRVGNIHGHLHNEKINNNKYFNVNIDINDFNFVSFDYIKEYFKINRMEK